MTGGSIASLTRLDPEAAISLANAVREMVPGPDATVFAACEASEMQAPAHALDETGRARERLLASGYRKRGLAAEEVDVAKRSPARFGDAEAVT